MALLSISLISQPLLISKVISQSGQSNSAVQQLFPMLYFFLALVNGESSYRMKSSRCQIIIFYQQYLLTKAFYYISVAHTQKYYLNRCQCLVTQPFNIQVNFQRNSKIIWRFYSFRMDAVQLYNSALFYQANSLFSWFELIISLITHYNKFLIPILVAF